MILSRFTRAEAVFERQQSLEMRAREWEERLRPARPWINDILTLLGIIVIGVVVLFFLPDARDGLMAWRGR